MSTKLPFTTLDVFTNSPFRGNQLAIIHVPKTTTLTQSQQQTIAIEFNYSETVFLNEKTSPSSQTPTYTAQIFTPKSEIPFAGHPTIGTAVYIFTNLEKDAEEIILNLKAGPVKATFDRATGRARCEIPQESHIHAAKIPGSTVGTVQPGLLNAKSTEGLTVDVASIVRGMNFALIDLSASPSDLSSITVTKDNVITPDHLDANWPVNLQGDVFYTVQPQQTDDVIRIRQRVIVIELEDPATGAASGALASFLALKEGKGGKTYRVEIEQGVEMGRRSVIGVEVRLDGEGSGVEMVALLGGAVEVMEGTLKF